MAKRYGNSKKSVVRTRNLGGQNYDPQSMADGGVISQNMSQHANLPQNVIMREYPMAEYADFPYLDDTMRASDNRMKQDKALMNKGMGKDIKY